MDVTVDHATLLRLAGVQQAVAATTHAMATEANATAVTEDAVYAAKTYTDRGEAIGVVYPDTITAAIDDSYHSTLLKVVGNRATG